MIVVYDVAAKTGGAKTVLIEYYKKALLDKKHRYLFVLCDNLVNSKDNCEVLVISWVKKSWLHRIICDKFFITKICKKYGCTEIISLQNIPVKIRTLKQTVLVQNALFFSDYKISLFKHPKLWFYKTTLGFILKRRLMHVEKIIVQTYWMKQKICLSCGIDENKVFVERPNIELNINSSHNRVSETRKEVCFFYPAAPVFYKNHNVILNAIQQIKDCPKFNVVFTFKGNENRLARRIKRIVDINSLPIIFVGTLNSEEMIDYYSNSHLVFASFVETVGYPLVESKRFGNNIICSNLDYAKESLADYNKAIYFNPNNPKDLAVCMKSVLKNEI